MPKDQWNAFIRDDICMEPAKPGALEGLEFSVKDVFAVKGHTNSAGNPDWLRTHEEGIRTAPVVEALLAGGARLRGLTHTDELMYSLSGENIHYGTPVNPKAPGRIPGGSSSGSAVAVAAGLSDFALGTDTGGSVRIPASYCGIYGFRPTHGAVSAEGVIPLAKSFDTVGWLARSSEVLLKIGQALLKPDESDKAVKPGQTDKIDKTDKPDNADGSEQTGVPFAQVWFAEDAWRLIAPEVRVALAPAGPVMQGLLGGFRRVALAEEGLSEWAATFRTIQGYEVWQEHGEWVQQAHPRFAPDIGGRFEWAAAIAREDYERSERKRREIGLYMEELVKEDGLLVIPTAPKAPDRGLRPEHTERTRTLAMELCCIAGLCGFPQMTVPFAEAGGVPVGLSFIAGRGRDMALLEWVHENLAPLLSAEEGRLEA